MNKGISKASGDYLCFLNSDDCFASKTTVSELVREADVEKLEAVFGFVDVVDINNPKNIVRKYRVTRLNSFLLRMGIMPAHPGFLCKRSFFLRFGGFVVDKTIAPDFELMVRFLVKGNLRAGLLPKTVVKMKSGGISNSDMKYILGRFSRQVKSCKINGLWTCSLLVLAKYPYKLLEFLR